MMKGKVLTPGGYRDTGLVHRVMTGRRLHRVGRGYEIRDMATGKIHSSIPSSLTPATTGAPGNGWQAYANWMNGTGTPVSLLQATFVVPLPPTDPSAQTVFLFPGIENLQGNIGILQPVLQWGVSALGGGPVWTVASWYVPTTGEAFPSNDLVPVAPGDVLTGVIRLTASANGVFSYTSEFNGIAGTHLSVNDIPELTWCNLTLETYNVTHRAQYPNTISTAFSDVNLVAAPPVTSIPWGRVSVPGAFGVGVNIINQTVPGGQVDIVY